MQSLAEANPSGSQALLRDGARLGPVELNVTDIARALSFYNGVIGLETLQRTAASATLGSDGEAVILLNEERAAQPPGRTAGIYHYALLFPSREELSRVAMRVLRARAPIDGASDHGTHEAIYLPDPDGIGIELAADRPRELWPSYADSEFAQGGPKPLDLHDLLEHASESESEAGAAAGARIGHVHLHVADLDAATRFYRDGIGFEVMAELPTAVFVSFARYHHHLAYNVWRGHGVPSADPDAIGLRHWTLELADAAELERIRERLGALGAQFDERDSGLLVRDPSGIALALEAN